MLIDIEFFNVVSISMYLAGAFVIVIVWFVGFTTTYMQSVSITTKCVSSNPAHDEVCSMII